MIHGQLLNLPKGYYNIELHASGESKNLCLNNGKDFELSNAPSSESNYWVSVYAFSNIYVTEISNSVFFISMTMI